MWRFFNTLTAKNSDPSAGMRYHWCRTLGSEWSSRIFCLVYYLLVPLAKPRRFIRTYRHVIELLKTCVGFDKPVSTCVRERRVHAPSPWSRTLGSESRCGTLVQRRHLWRDYLFTFYFLILSRNFIAKSLVYC